MTEFCAELSGITKRYGDVAANQDVQLQIKAGTIHALVGENGAGKSTAMRILFGLVKPDNGEIRFEGKQVSSETWSPQKAFRSGIGMVHQHFMLAGPETVLDNLVLGVETCKFGVRDRKAEKNSLEKLMKESGLVVPLEVKLENLPIGQQSRCEILKVLYRNARFLILDEPTSVLTPHEVEEFLKILKKLRDIGKTILIVTHKLKEVMEVADEVTILRGGKTIATKKISDTNIEELSELMVGRKLALPKVSAISEREKLPVLYSSKSFGFDIRVGEMVGIAGVEGNGQEKLIHGIIEEYFSKKTNLKFLSLIPSDRHHQGLVLDFSLYENLRLTRKYHPFKKNLENFETVSQEEIKLLNEYDVRPQNPLLKAGSLSGGNQQKLIVARELSQLPENSLVLAVHPTRGVDLGAIEFIHHQLIKAAQQGAGVLLISSELEELMSLSTRIGVIFREKISKWFELKQEQNVYDEKMIGLAMLGGEE